jgi:hypothetical protein
MNVVGHDAVADYRVIGMEFQDLGARNRRKFWILEPTTAVSSTHGQIEDVILTVVDLVGEMVLFPALHGRIVPVRTDS